MRGAVTVSFFTETSYLLRNHPPFWARLSGVRVRGGGGSRLTTVYCVYLRLKHPLVLSGSVLEAV